jgi:GTP cyclohydrolase I
LGKQCSVMSPLAKAADPRHPETASRAMMTATRLTMPTIAAFTMAGSKAPAHGAFPTLARIRLPFGPEYLPAGRILGLSKLARLVEHFAARPQTQERLTRQVADALVRHLGPRGAGVVLEAEHSCMTQRGVRTLGAKRSPRPCPGRCATIPAPGPSSSPWPACPADTSNEGGTEMSESTAYVIVGASLGGAKAAKALRAEGFGGRSS